MNQHIRFAAVSLVGLFTLLAGCRSPDAGPAVSGSYNRKRPEVLSEPVAALSTDLNTLIEKQITGRALLGLKKPDTLSDEKLAELKVYFKTRAPGAFAGKSRDKKINVAEALKKSEFHALTKTPLDELIRATGKLAAPVAESLSNTLAKATECVPAPVSLAFGTLVERKFPDAEAVKQATSLYEKAYNCGSGEVKARAAYRLGLFSLAANDCEKSKTYWDAVTRVEEVKFLFSRAQYWKNHCEQEAQAAQAARGEPQQRRIAMDFYNNFPLSFHTIQVFKENKEELGALVLSRPDPKVQIRSEKFPRLNSLIEQMELAFEERQFEKIREYDSWLATWLTEERTGEVEPHVRLYLAYLSYASRDGLNAFQLLSRTFSQYPELKSPATLKLFYPKWFFAEIQKEAEASGLDPLLVLSLVRQESAFNEAAVSKVGARGLMQLMPRTARSLDHKLRTADLLVAAKNIHAGTLYFAGLVKRYNGNVALALAAYNAGYGAVDTWVSRYRVENPLLFADLIPYRETREYVGSILRNLYWYQALEKQTSVPKVIIGDLQFSPKKDI